MNRTENCKANSRQKSKANGRQKSKANSRQEKSKANSRQSKPKNYDRDEAKYEEKTQYRGKLQPASPEACKNRCRCSAGAIRAEGSRPSQRSTSPRK